MALTDQQIQGGKEMKNKTRFKILSILAIIIALTGGFIAYKRHESREKYYALYRHGFQLLEEQIAYYIVENYSGVSKVEFSPIFINTESPFQYISVVPVVYDKEGNRALLAGDIGGVGYEAPSTGGAIGYLTTELSGKHIIELPTSSYNDEVDVSEYSRLPEKAKLTSHETYDRMMEDLVKYEHLKGIKRDDLGSPESEIVYNLEIKEGDWETWR